MSKRGEGTVIKLLAYLYTIYPANATREHICKNGKFSRPCLDRHIESAMNMGWVVQRERKRPVFGYYTFDPSFQITTTGIKHLNAILDKANLKEVTRKDS